MGGNAATYKHRRTDGQADIPVMSPDSAALTLVDASLLVFDHVNGKMGQNGWKVGGVRFRRKAAPKMGSHRRDGMEGTAAWGGGQR